MREDVRKWTCERNQDIIDRSYYQFVYAEHSDVFHRRECHAILVTTDVIQGACYYDSVIKTGRRPCKLCKPDADSGMNTAEKKKEKSAERQKADTLGGTGGIPSRSLNAREQCAYTRYNQARAERFNTERGSFKSETEKNDFYTLTQPRYSFFCSAGYQTFHRRNCQKLHGLSNITGFSRYRDAIRAGHTPCRFCKPSAKQDIECSIPINNKKRKGESINDLETLCNEQGYAYEIADQYFCFTTAVGKWKIDLVSKPFVVYHINRVRTPGNEHDYHRQPRLFLSLLDTFEYIHRHDRDMMRASGETEQEQQEEAV